MAEADRLGEAGYAYADVAVVPVADSATHEVALTFMIEPNSRTYVRRIEFAGVERTNFGSRAQAIVGYLTGRLSASHRDVVEAMAVLYGLRLSTGSVSAIQRQVSAALGAPVEQARRFVCRQKAQYVDETGWREAGQMKWLWVNATKDVTAFHLLDGRSAGDAQQVIDQSARGIVATDRYGSYNWLAARRRQVCWAHIARDSQAMVERGGESEQTGRALLTQVERLRTVEIRQNGVAERRQERAAGRHRERFCVRDGSGQEHRALALRLTVVRGGAPHRHGLVRWPV